MSAPTQKNTQTTRVNSDDLFDEYPGYTNVTFKGKPFTGIGFEIQNGQIINETSYVDGAEDGPERSWYPNGQLESVGENKLNRPHGQFKTWYPSGQLKSEGLVEAGYVIWRKEWDEEGSLIVEDKIEDHSDGLKDLQSAKIWTKRYGSPA